MSVEILAILFVFFTFLFLLSGIPVAFILSGSALIFAFIGIYFEAFDSSFLLAIPSRIYGIMINQKL